jgi:hypothetical protein
MSKLWIFGDSFSATNKRSNIESWRREYAKWKGYTTDVWPEILNNQLNYKLLYSIFSSNYAQNNTYILSVFYSKII